MTKRISTTANRTTEHSIAVTEAIRHIVQNTSIKCRSDYSLKANDPRGVWAGVHIEQGDLVINPDVVHPGDLLHEAGHLAITPLEIRLEMDGDLNECERYRELINIRTEHPRDYPLAQRSSWGRIAGRMNPSIG